MISFSKPKKLGLLLALLLIGPAHTRANLVFEFLWGANFQLPAPLIEYGLGTPVVHRPKWENRAFSPIWVDSPYWAARNGIWDNSHTWAIEAEWIHMKMYLVNTDSHIQKFDISHGYNLFMINYARKIHVHAATELIFRVGLGLVIANAESIIDGVYNGLGAYYNAAVSKAFTVAGISGQIALQLRIPVADYLIGTIELKYTAGYAMVDYSGKIDPDAGDARENLYTGRFHIPQHSIHIAFGFGLDFYHLFHFKKGYPENVKRAYGTSIKAFKEMDARRKAKKLEKAEVAALGRRLGLS